MEKDYRIGYAIVSLIFITNAVGFISAAPIAQALQARLGRAKTLVLAQSVIAAGYVIIVCKPPFPVVVVFFFLGLGTQQCFLRKPLRQHHSTRISARFLRNWWHNRSPHSHRSRIPWQYLEYILFYFTRRHSVQSGSCILLLSQLRKRYTCRQCITSYSLGPKSLVIAV